MTIRGRRGGTHRGEGIPGNIYRLQETLQVPWSQDFRVDGGNYLLIYEGTQGHALARVPNAQLTLVNRPCFAVQALILTPEDVSGWTLNDGGSTAQTNPFNLSLVDNARLPAHPLDPPRLAISQAVDGLLRGGESLVLQRGDAVRFKYASAPTWRWKAL